MQKNNQIKDVETAQTEEIPMTSAMKLKSKFKKSMGSRISLFSSVSKGSSTGRHMADFIDIQEKRGKLYYFIRLMAILAFPLLLAIGFASYEVYYASKNLDKIGELRAYIVYSKLTFDIMSAFMNERGRAAYYLTDTDLLSAMKYKESIYQTDKSFNMSDKHDRIITNDFKSRVSALRSTVFKANISLDNTLNQYSLLIKESSTDNARGLYIDQKSLWMNLHATLLFSIYLNSYGIMRALGTSYLLGCPARWSQLSWFIQNYGQTELMQENVFHAMPQLDVHLKKSYNYDENKKVRGFYIEEMIHHTEFTEMLPHCINFTRNQRVLEAEVFFFLLSQDFDNNFREFDIVREQVVIESEKESMKFKTYLMGIGMFMVLLFVMVISIGCWYSTKIIKVIDNTKNLAELILCKKEEVEQEKKRADTIVFQMLPASIAIELRKGIVIEPISYSESTVYFSDIANFQYLVKKSRPIEVMTLLNDIYQIFDARLVLFDVYKVETISDTYMVVSGVPRVNGKKHVTEIARMSLDLLESTKNTIIEHLPEEQLQLRIGIHSGPVVAGLVGLKNPRYCLFGDTVNTASRMESHGEPLRIHISNYTAELLTKSKIFKVKERGEILVKGKGAMITYWLIAETSSKKARFQDEK